MTKFLNLLITALLAFYSMELFALDPEKNQESKKKDFIYFIDIEQVYRECGRPPAVPIQEKNFQACRNSNTNRADMCSCMEKE